jgi:uncharacterized protein YihD (DUF1040 family)
MRDTKRIDRVLKIIKRIWKDNPDLRLFQLLLNPYGPEELPILYNQEEDQIIARLIRFYGPEQALKIVKHKTSKKDLEKLFGINDNDKVMIRKKERKR